MIRPPPTSTLFPTRRSSDLDQPRRRLLADTRHLRQEGSILVGEDRKSTRLNSSHLVISYAVFCLKKKMQPVLVCRVQLDVLLLSPAVRGRTENLGSETSRNP